MRRYVNRAILFKEWKNGLWITIVFSFMIFTRTTSEFLRLVYSYNAMYKQNQTVSKINFMFHMNGSRQIAFIIFLAVVVVLIMGMNKENEHRRLGALPIKRDEIIVSKGIVLIISILLPFFINFLIMQLYYLLYKGAVDMVLKNSMTMVLVKWMLINVLTDIFVISFCILIHCIIGRAIVSCITGVLLMFLPSVLLVIIGILSGGVYSRYIFKAQEYINLFLYNTVESNIGSLSKLIILMAVSIGLWYLIITIYKRIPAERCNEIFIFKQLEGISKIFISIFIGLLLYSILLVTLIYGEPRNTMMVIIINLVPLFAIPIVYKIINRISRIA